MNDLELSLVEQAMKKCFFLGQVYWTNPQTADETMAKFIEIKDMTIATLRRGMGDE